MPKTLLLVRHGETDFNTDPTPRVRGRVPVPLNAAGRRHAAQAAEFLRAEPIDVVYYSAVPRARETAEFIHRLHPGARFVEEPLVIDISWGDWEGKTYQEAFGDPEGRLFFDHPERMHVPNGEQLLECQSRMRDFVFEVLARPEQTVCVVSHGATLNLLACLAFESPLRNFWTFYMAGCGVSKLEVHAIDRYVVKYWNHSQHLSDE